MASTSTATASDEIDKILNREAANLQKETEIKRILTALKLK
jgi:hypothetical protein